MKVQASLVAVLTILILSEFASAQEPCRWDKKTCLGNTGRTIQVSQQVPLTAKKWVLIDMGGVSDNLDMVRYQDSDAKFKFTPIDTKHPKKLSVNGFISGRIYLIMNANDDTRTDMVRVQAVSIDTTISFSDENKKIILDVKNGTRLNITVFNLGMPNQTPGAFSATIVVKGLFVRKKHMHTRRVVRPSSPL